MQVVKLRARFAREYNDGKSHRDIYQDAIAEGLSEKIVTTLVGQIPDKASAQKMRWGRYLIMLIMLLVVLAMALNSLLHAGGGGMESLLAGAFLLEAVIACVLGWMVFGTIMSVILCCLSCLLWDWGES